MQVLTGISDTQGVAGTTAAAPAAFARICGFDAVGGNVLPKGVYTVVTEVHQSGTPDTNVVNGSLNVGGAARVRLPSTSSSTQPLTISRVALDGATDLTLAVSGSAGGAGAVYNGVLLATKIA